MDGSLIFDSDTDFVVGTFVDWGNVNGSTGRYIDAKSEMLDMQVC
jgi:hypothetical protein